MYGTCIEYRVHGNRHTLTDVYDKSRSLIMPLGHIRYKTSANNFSCDVISIPCEASVTGATLQGRLCTFTKTHSGPGPTPISFTRWLQPQTAVTWTPTRSGQESPQHRQPVSHPPILGNLIGTLPAPGFPHSLTLYQCSKGANTLFGCLARTQSHDESWQ